MVLMRSFYPRLQTRSYRGRLYRMALIYGMTLLLLFQLLGEVGVRMLGAPVPGPVLGMLLLFLLLLIRGSVPGWLEQTTSGLLAHLSLLFVPAGVGLMVHFHRIGAEWAPIAVALLLSTLLTLVVTAWVMQGFSRLLSRGEPNGE